MEDGEPFRIGDKVSGRAIVSDLLAGSEPLAFCIVGYPSTDGEGLVVLDFMDPEWSCPFSLDMFRQLTARLIENGHIGPRSGHTDPG